MDISSILTTLWNKISKPIPNILIGAVFLQFAPKEIQWLGYIFWAIGISPIIEKKWEEYQINTKINFTFRNLNAGEQRVLAGMIKNNQQTISINYSDYHSAGNGLFSYTTPPRGNRNEYIELFGICEGLQSKGIFFVVSNTDVTSFSAFPEAWVIMKKLYQKNPELFRSEEATDA